MYKFLNTLRKNSILVTLFITGACVLIIEVVAVRLMSPYFGNTIYSYSSILSVVLAALSAGYYYGGKLADKTPEEALFYKIISISGFATGACFLVSPVILARISNDFSITTGPLIASVVLFSLPAFLLGLLSPFGVTLENKKSKVDGIGTTSGKIFFVSTLGSIFGSLIAGYLLVPVYGVATIFVGVSLVLVLLGVFGNTIVKKNLTSPKNIFLAILFFSILTTVSHFLDKNAVYSKDGIYEKIKVVDFTNSEGRPVRYLIQDRSASSGMYLDSKDLLFNYTKYYDINKIAGITPKNALVIGSGAYSIPKAILTEYPDIESIDTVDIEPVLEEVAVKYFDYTKTPKIKSHFIDGRVFLNKTEKNYDYVFVDVYQTIYAMPSHFTTKEFFAELKSKLTPGGVIAMNVIGSLDQSTENQLTFGLIKTFSSEFPNTHIFALDGKDTKNVQNLIIVGVNSTGQINLKTNMRLVNDLEEKHSPVSRFNLSNYQTFTDNYAPIEYLSAKMYERSLDDVSENSKTNIYKSQMIEYINDQTTIGPRYTGSEGQTKIHKYILSKLNAQNVKVIEQDFVINGAKSNYDAKNIVAQINPEKEKRIIIGSHFDTLKVSKDTGEPMIGANNGASGTAVLLDLAKELKAIENDLTFGIDIIFFDAEDGTPEAMPGNPDWRPFGSEYFAKNLGTIYKNKLPSHGIILDVVCAKNSNFFYETSSSRSAFPQMKRFWEIGKTKMPNSFIQSEKYSIMDDHIPLIKAGIPSFLVIDMDYKYIHSIKDTPENCDNESLENMKKILMEYIYTL